MSNDSTQYCYSWDDDHFNSGRFDSVEEALADAVAEDDGQDGVYVAEAEPWDNSAFYPSASWVLEHMQEQAWGEAGEHADDYAAVSIEAREELNQQLTALLDAWCQQHGVVPQFYRVKKSVLYSLPVKTK